MTSPGPSASSTTTRHVLAAWQDALAAEHEAVFGYSLVGPRLPASLRQRALTDQGAHEQLRQVAESAIRAAGARPVAAAADYPALYPVTDAMRAQQVALRLEQNCASAWRYLFLQAAAPRDTDALRSTRTAAQAALTACAVREVGWRQRVTPAAPTVAFPGLDR